MKASAEHGTATVLTVLTATAPSKWKGDSLKSHTNMIGNTGPFSGLKEAVPDFTEIPLESAISY